MVFWACCQNVNATPHDARTAPIVLSCYSNCELKPNCQVSVGDLQTQHFCVYKKHFSPMSPKSLSHCREINPKSLVAYTEELKSHLRTFALIVSAHPYCARNSLPRHALSARAVGEMWRYIALVGTLVSMYGFNSLKCSVTPYFLSINHFLCQLSTF